jgi:hypothetical protein
MTEITTIITSLHPLLDASAYRQFQIISQTLPVMTCRITMLGLSHWTEGKGGNYRTIQHFFTKDIPWSFSDPLNLVLISKTNVKTGKVARVILFSTDLGLEWSIIIDYYCLRFLIEFNFRTNLQFQLNSYKKCLIKFFTLEKVIDRFLISITIELFMD